MTRAAPFWLTARLLGVACVCSWPRDIDANHPEQKEELDALAAIVAEETAKKEAEKAKKRKKKMRGGKKRARASRSDAEEV